ncbi:PKD domain-containing protein [Colwellia psychrerythraea]|uniref:Thermitase, Xanthomonalisin n=1 Tax=Colwellia psychrerythraea TaxID=28229 RepID=A0A099L7S2_COLPS|nr:PKD domain-containing protein [Colwellia psychrerythraea]KGJ97943.1 Thermitase, Xanthomonalisin [Colwellia psychrerythraea]
MKKFTKNTLASAVGLAFIASMSTAHAAPPARLIVKSNPVMSAFSTESSADMVIGKMSTMSALSNTSVQQVKTTWDGRNVVELSGNFTEAQLAQIIANMESDASIDEVEIDRLMYPTATPNDPRYSDQWHYFDATGGINADTAWNTTTGAGVTVAVLDTGVIYHNDLVGNLVGGYDFVSNVNMGRDGDGRDSDPSDPGDSYNGGGSSWHGTHVAGTIAAVTNNNNGVAGVAYGAKILPVRVLGAGGGYSSDITDGIVWAAGGYVAGIPVNNNPAQVINMSLGGAGACGSLYQNAINQAVSLGAVVVVAAGNSAVDVSGATPANCNNVISVAATNSSGNRASFSNYGSLIDVSAPGVNILSTHNTGYSSPGGDSYSTMSGTSMAAPHIAGVAALVYASGVATSPAAIESRIVNTARTFPGSCYGCGSGIADANAAVNGGGNDQNQSPVSQINGPYQGDLNSAVSFSSAGTFDPDGSISSYSWDFGDGYTSNQANPTHSYTSENTFNVSLTVSDNKGATATANTTAVISNNVTAVLENGIPVNGLSANTGQSVDYTFEVPANATELVISASGGSGDADLYARFGSAPTDAQYDCRPYLGGNNETCNVSNPQAGTWYISAKAYASFSGLTLQASFQGGNTIPNKPPVANSGGPYTGIEGQPITFIGSASYDTDGAIATYNWDFGDGTTSNQADPSHSYSVSGSYSVVLTVTDNKGSSTTTNTTAEIKASGGKGVLENGVSVTTSGNTGSEDNYTLQVPSGANDLVIKTNGGSGDGDLFVRFGSAPTASSYDCRPYLSGNNETCTIVNAQAGTYYVMVQGYSSYSTTLTASYTSGGTPIPNVPPVSDAGGPYSGTVNAEISFVGSNSFDNDGQITTYNWNFGDGSSISQANPNHVYTTAGTYTATLTVTDDKGATATSSSLVTVVESPLPIGLADACTSQSPQDYITASNGSPICVTSGSGGNLYFYFDSNGSSSATIRTEHGTGDANIYYRQDSWPSASQFMLKSDNTANTESITVNNLTDGWHYIMVSGNHSGLTIQVDHQ